MRYIDAVIGDMLGVIPDDEVELRFKLKGVVDSSLYLAPEIMHKAWRQTMEILIDEIGEPQKEWEITVAKIFKGPPEVELMKGPTDA